jgi:2-dehydro-3-deoxyphosphooctonate aldolase (KDO 8-P synthase)
MNTVKVGGFEIANNKPFALIAGPCQIESEAMAMETAHELVEICKGLGLNLIYKSSFDKANRTSIAGARGIGLDKALQIFADIKAKYGCPITTDVHKEDQCAPVAEVADVLQIPAFLCRQTDLLVAAGNTGKVVNVKKGQFLAPWDMANVVKKLESTGNRNIMLCERGTMMGYNRLINDMRALPIMADTGYPVVFDATHSVQEPGGAGSASGGERRFVKTVARAAVAVGVGALFIETHPKPEEAASDGPCQVHLHKMKSLLQELMEFDRLAKQYPSEY